MRTWRSWQSRAWVSSLRRAGLPRQHAAATIRAFALASSQPFVAMPPELQPWIAAAIALLDVRRQDRLLAIEPGLAQVRALAASVGNGGHLTLVLRDRAEAERTAELGLPQVTVLAHPTSGGERFGTFDALLLTPTCGPLLAPGAYADLAKRNLRPGGRFVVDVPGPDMVPDLCAAAHELRWPDARCAVLRGLADDQLAEVLRNAGLREVTGVLGAHLLSLGTPGDLTFAFAEAMGLTEPERLELTHALVRRRSGTGPCDVLVHRTRLLGRR